MSRGEVVVVTGASAGLGRAIACAWARRGARIGALTRGTEGLDAAHGDVEAFGGRALVAGEPRVGHGPAAPQEAR